MTTSRTTFWLCCAFLLQQAARAASSDGYVIQWGWNGGGDVITPAKLVLSNATAISAGTFHSLALRPDGTVYGWGGDLLGAVLGSELSEPAVTNGIVRINGRILSNAVSIVAGRGFSLALKNDGTVVTWGENNVPAGLTNMAALAAGWSSSWALKRDGAIVGWVSNPSLHDYGKLLPVEHLSNVVAIAFGPGGYGSRGVALRRDGTVGHWGGETIHNDATPPSGLSNVVSIAAGANHSLALKRDGTVVGWGFNTVGQATGTPTTNAPYVSWGQVSIGGQVLSNIVSIAAGTGYSIALRKDGTVVGWGRMLHDRFPVNIPPGLSNVVAIAAGAQDFCLAITTNSRVAAQFLPTRGCSESHLVKVRIHW